MTNCPNCNAPIEPYNCKCKYCGTYYFDFSGFDATDNEPCYIKVGKHVCFARPFVESIENKNDYADVSYIDGRYRPVLLSTNIDINVIFSVISYHEEDQK